jgi:hypothetical protein
MEVARGSKVGKIEVGDRHFGHDAGVGKDVPLPTVGKEDSDAGSGGFADNVGRVEAGFGKARGGDVSHLVGSYLRSKADAGAKEGEIMG